MLKVIADKFDHKVKVLIESFKIGLEKLVMHNLVLIRRNNLTPLVS